MIILKYLYNKTFNLQNVIKDNVPEVFIFHHSFLIFSLISPRPLFFRPSRYFFTPKPVPFLSFRPFFGAISPFALFQKAVYNGIKLKKTNRTPVFRKEI
ncbi:hypothetical protein DW091_11410 [Eubacterium sp. AM05-23]|nr:hypothetical protein DW091_11410 [Eubacterium sp. AM05-23]